jgi:hypothetical protein
MVEIYKMNTTQKLKPKFRRAFWGAFLIVSCGTLVGNPEEEDSTATQTRYRAESQTLEPTTTASGETIAISSKGLSLLLTDAPVDGAKAVYLTIKGVSVKGASDSWVVVPVKAESEINLLNLQDGNAVLLAALETLPNGSYKEIRLELSETAPARIVLADDTEHALTIPSGEESGLKIKYDFEISDEKGSIVVLDFDLRRSIHTTGGPDDPANSQKMSDQGEEAKNIGAALQRNATAQPIAKTEHAQVSGHDDSGTDIKYILKPVIRAIEREKSGSIVGKAGDGDVVCIYPKGSEADPTSDCANALGSAKGRAGKFHLPYLPEGEYTVRIFPKSGKAKDYSSVKTESGKKVELVDE